MPLHQLQEILHSAIAHAEADADAEGFVIEHTPPLPLEDAGIDLAWRRSQGLQHHGTADREHPQREPRQA